MRLAELAERSGLPVATIKYYLREQLLAPGAAQTKTQAQYGETHLRRLRLIRALREVADLPVAAIAEVLAAVDDETLPLGALLGTTQYAVAGRPTDAGLDTTAARGLLADLGWTLLPDSPLIGPLAAVLGALEQQGEPIDAQSLQPWARAAWSVAEVEVGQIPLDAPRSEAAEIVAVGTVLFGELLSALRLAAQEAISLDRFALDSRPDGAACQPAVRTAGSARAGRRRR